MGRTTVFRSPVDRKKVFSKLILLGALIAFLLIPFDLVLIKGLDGRSEIMGMDSTLFMIILDTAVLIIPLLILSFRIRRETRYYSDDRIELTKGSVRIINHVPGSMRSWDSEIRSENITSIGRIVPESGWHLFTTLGDEGLSAVPGRSYEKFTHPYYHDDGLIEIRLRSRSGFRRWDVFRPKEGYEKVRKPLSSQKENPPVDLDRIIISIDPHDMDEFIRAVGKSSPDTHYEINYSPRPSGSDIFRFNVKQITSLFLLYLIPLALLLAYSFASPNVSASAVFRTNVIYGASIGSILLVPLILFLSFIEIPTLRKNWNIDDQTITGSAKEIDIRFTFSNSIGGKEIVRSGIPIKLIKEAEVISPGRALSLRDRILFPLTGLPPGTLYNPIIRSQDIVEFRLSRKIDVFNYLPGSNILRKRPDPFRTDIVTIGIDPAMRRDLPGLDTNAKGRKKGH